MSVFLVLPEDVWGDILVLRNQEAHHLARVRRLRPDDRIEVIDGLGHCYQVRVAAIARAEVRCEILSCRDECGENPVQLSLAPALVKGARFDSIVEKATEIGVGCIAPVIADRGVVQPGTGNKIERWRRLIRAAAKQCGRSRLPVLYSPAPLEVVLDCLRRRSDFLLMASPQEPGQEPGPHLRECVAAARPMRPGLLIGPEGGFTRAEREKAINLGATVFSWGERTMRTDTASCVLAALVLHEAEQAQGTGRRE